MDVSTSSIIRAGRDVEPQLSSLPSVAERLRNLRPSQELLDFYRQKISEFDGEHADLLSKLERYKSTFEDQHKIDWQLARREEEIGELQKALSDMQLYLFQEREHVLRLYAENDRLKIQEVEDRKKIQSLLGLTQPVEHETTYFKAPGELKLIGAKGKAKGLVDRPQEQLNTFDEDGVSGRGGKKKKRGAGAAAAESTNASVEALLLTIEALKAQLQDQARLNKDQVQALIDDRRVREEEAKVLREQEAEKNKALIDRLHNTQNLLYDATRDQLALKYEFRQRERVFSEEKESLLQRIEELKDDIDSFRAATRVVPAAAGSSKDAATASATDQEEDKVYRDMGTNVYRPGGRPDATNAAAAAAAEEAAASAKSAAEAQAENMQETLADMYREQAIKLEDELCRLREEKEAARGVVTDKAEKMAKKVKLWQKRFTQLEKRRALEVEGYKTDIKLLRKRLRDLERQLYRLAVHMGDAGSETEMKMLKDVKLTASRSRRAVEELQHLKAKIYNVENDVRSLQDNGVNVSLAASR